MINFYFGCFLPHGHLRCKMTIFFIHLVEVGEIGVATQKHILGPVGYKNKETSPWHC